MDAATALSAVQTVLAALDCQDLRKLCSMLKYKSELKDLIETVGTIKKLLLQADTESLELNHVGQDWVNKLKDAVYDTEDLFDEYKTVAEQHKYKKPGRIISKKVRLFFSSKKLAFNMSREIKKVREQLDKIAKDHKDFGFSTLYKPARIKEETCSYVYEQNIIGRDADKKKIVDLLLKDDLENNISFVTIVGIGGLGKTALAKLVFSDHRIREAFEENMMYWVCVSENFGMKDILGKMIGNKNLEFEDLYKKVRNKIERKRYFLVLDDVWCEEGIKWDDLRDFLKLGGKGSRILVTSRSEAVATAIGNYPMHKLQGLSEKDSWELFRKISLGDNKEDEAIAGFVEIGRDILKKCASVPLSIRVVVESVKMHDLMHVLARKVAGKESLSHEVGKVRHLFVDSEECVAKLSSSSNYTCKTLRTLFMMAKGYSDEGEFRSIISKFIRIRALSINSYFRALPDTLGRLLHLRYLDLSHNYNLEMLPKSITKLHNLQTLKLANCGKLIELPEDTSKLVNFRVLNIEGCDSLTHMPAGMGKLTSLHTLAKFVVCEDDDHKQDKKGKLIDMKAVINNLRGDLDITNMNSIIGYFGKYMKVELDSLKIKYDHNCYQEGQKKLLEILFFNSKSRELRITWYNGTKLPTSWASGLVSIDLSHCDELKYLPSSLSQLCNLKCLSLWFMKNMEYIECNAPSPSAKFFPCLEKLEFVDMPKLEGWWRDVTWMEKVTVFIPSFPQLCELCISSCERLAYIPQCPHLKKLNLNEVNEALTFYKKEGGVESNPIYLNKLTIDYSCVFNPLIGEYMGSADSVCIRLSDIENLGTIREGFQSCASSIHEPYLKNCRGMENLGIEHLTNLNSLTLVNNIEGIPWNSLHSLSSLCLHSCDDLEELGECVTSLKSLQLFSLFGCKELKSLPKVICHLTSLTTLDITVCPQLKSLPEAIKHLTSLATIKILDCPELKSLPEAIKYLTSLATLEIEDCPELKSLPEAIKHLTSLNTLTLINPSSELEDRCHEKWEDWLKICHFSYYNDY